MQKSFQPWLSDSRQQDRWSVVRTVLGRRDYDLISKIAAERLHLQKHVLKLGPAAFLLLLPPVPQRRALLQSLLEDLARFGQSIREIWNCRIDHSVIGQIRQKIGFVAQPRTRN